MSGFFTSDLHLGHRAAAHFREFESVDEHDDTIVHNINARVNKRDKLFILGDLAFSDKGLNRIFDINCQNIELLMGNHDKYPAHRYFKYVQKLHGFYKYKDFWLSHCPIHPNEMYRAKGNLHGHVHKTSNSPRIEDPRYFNVNIDMNNMFPISFKYILERFDKI